MYSKTVIYFGHQIPQKVNQQVQTDYRCDNRIILEFTAAPFARDTLPLPQDDKAATTRNESSIFFLLVLSLIALSIQITPHNLL